MTAETSVEYRYHVLDETTPWHDWICYCEICHQLNVPDQPSLRRFMSFRRYLKSAGLL